jgi:hypothetical protein
MVFLNLNVEFGLKHTMVLQLSYCPETQELTLQY